MANFAQIDENTGRVYQVIVISNQDCNGGTFPESEEYGQRFIRDVLKMPGLWKQTSYNSNFRQRLAGIDGTYDFNLDKFLPPRPFNSWTLNENTYEWDPPVPYPDDGQFYIWNESTLSWKLVEGGV